MGIFDKLFRKKHKPWSFVQEIPGKGKGVLIRESCEIIQSILREAKSKRDRELEIVIFAARLAGYYSMEQTGIFGQSYLNGNIVVKRLRSGREAVDHPDWDEPCYFVLLK
jgi:hypothetical protein